MSKPKRVIELNGKKYDAGTGQEITGSHHARPHSARSIDGVIGTTRPKKATNHHAQQTHHQSQQPAHPQTTHQPVHPAPHKKAHTTHHQAKHVAHHKVQKSKSLMRHAVQKPVTESSAPAITPKVSRSRLHRAQAVPQSHHISKFSTGTHVKHQPQFKPLSIAQAPQEVPQSAPPTEVKHTAHKVSQSQKHFEAALAKADAHTHKPSKKHKRGAKLSKKLGVSRKVLNVSAMMAAFVLLAGFFAYQNVATISMQVAATRAGFDAQLPGYRPTGFALSGPIEYGPGYVSVDFASNSDERGFELTQQVSNWNSVALAENYLGSNSENYQVYNEKGKTIYVYDDANATWVSGGVWYDIKNHNVLTNEQLLKVVSSIQ